MTRRCPTCKTKKPLTLEYWYRNKYRGRNGGFSTKCKGCWKELRNTSSYRRDEHRRRKARYLTPQGRRRNWREQLLRNYRLTWTQYKELWAEQCGKCPSCGNWLRLPAGALGKMPNEGRPGCLASIHHCHLSGKVLGIWCLRCNRGAGNFEDRPDLMRKAADAHEKAVIA